MKNNNQAIVRKITGRTLRSDRRRNTFIIAAIALTTLLIASVFSIGASFIESQKMEQTRLMGTAAHAAVTNPTFEELEQLRGLDYIEIIGTGNHVATIKNTPQMGDMNLAFYCFDKTEWKELRSPAYTNIVGSYPQKENEIMVPYWILERLGIEPEIGMEIPLSYNVERDGEQIIHEDTFILSGWFTSYMHIRSGNIDSIKVSEAFSRKYNKTARTDGAATVLFTDSTRVNEYCARLEQDLNISADSERVRPVPMYDANGAESASTFIALALVVAFLMFTGYLLIYNVLYIAVSKDVRFYGLLKTIGTTPRQIRRIVAGQIIRLCVIGIPLGAALAALLSLLIIPALINRLISTEAVISFSPIIFIGAAIFALLTAVLGAAKPASTAAKVSPIEAQKYTGAEAKGGKIRFHANGKPYRMALRNIFRDRKRAVIVLLSLFLGITTFITITTLVASMDTDNYVASYVESDFILTNNTATLIGGDNRPKQKFSDDFIDTVKNIPGFESVRYETKDLFQLTYSDTFNAYLDAYLREFADDENISSQGLASIKDNFTCLAAGINGQLLSELDGTFEVGAFERGEYLLLATNNPTLLDGLEFVEIRSWPDGEILASVPVGGYVPLYFRSIGQSAAPTLIMSNRLMDELTGGAIRSKLYIDVADGYDTEFLNALQTLAEGDFEISRTSKIEARESLNDSKMMLHILGGGIALVLGMIGILNFINVMSVGVLARKREIATMESIGMTQGQTQKMLRFEGIGYAVITFALTFIVGSPITYGIFKLFQQQANYAIFTYPILPAIIAALIVLAVCVTTPEMAYRSLKKMSVVERLREAE